MTALKKFILFFALISYFQYAHAQNKVIPLYEKGIPNSKKPPVDYVETTDSNGMIRKVSMPSLTAYLPKKPNGTAVIIAPGGGYFVLAQETGVELAKAFNEAGITAFMLKYRLPSDDIMVNKSIGPLQDAQTAIKLLRENAKMWNINPNKLGMVGLSAGGHLVSTTGTQLDRIVIDNQEKTNLRPDFMILLYPVIVYDASIPRTRENLIGKTPTPELLNLYSTDKHVTANTPPTFLVHAVDDDVIPVKNSLAFFNALLNSKVKTEMHILQSGEHGFGISDLKSKDQWFQLCKSWMAENGF